MRAPRAAWRSLKTAASSFQSARIATSEEARRPSTSSHSAFCEASALLCAASRRAENSESFVAVCSELVASAPLRASVASLWAAKCRSETMRCASWLAAVRSTSRRNVANTPLTSSATRSEASAAALRASSANCVRRCASKSANFSTRELVLDSSAATPPKVSDAPRDASPLISSCSSLRTCWHVSRARRDSSCASRTPSAIARTCALRSKISTEEAKRYGGCASPSTEVPIIAAEWDEGMVSPTSTEPSSKGGAPLAIRWLCMAAALKATDERPASTELTLRGADTSSEVAMTNGAARQEEAKEEEEGRKVFSAKNALQRAKSKGTSFWGVIIEIKTSSRCEAWSSRAAGGGTSPSQAQRNAKVKKVSQRRSTAATNQSRDHARG